MHLECFGNQIVPSGFNPLLFRGLLILAGCRDRDLILKEGLPVASDMMELCDGDLLGIKGWEVGGR